MMLNANTINEDWVLPDDNEIILNGKPILIESFHYLYENDWFWPPQFRCSECMEIYPPETLGLHTETHVYAPCKPCNLFSEMKRGWQ